MARIDTSSYKTFDDVTGRLDQIVTSVRDRQTSLERSLDLFDEAIALGSRAVEMVDKIEFSPEEKAQMEAMASQGGGDPAPQAEADAPARSGDAS
ncbi:MAG: exodeoxyribonuclease VII small subunit [Atopobiaceae bacterium]|jgi:exonuclease VII small subunit|nr:exodeoxyribonuclease VII small subunit [Atopobiaceae bacterium]